LRVRLTEAAEPARGIHALLKRCEAAICTATAHATAVNRAPRIVLSIGWSAEHNQYADKTEHKQEKSHHDGFKHKNSASGYFDLSQNTGSVGWMAMSPLGAKRTLLGHAAISAFDPKRTSGGMPAIRAAKSKGTGTMAGSLRLDPNAKADRLGPVANGTLGSEIF
jgi:hypothetical protein